MNSGTNDCPRTWLSSRESEFVSHFLRTQPMSMTRKELTFASDGDKCAAWFYPAAADNGTRPVVVMAHGLTGTRRDRFNAFADRFAAAGIAALVFDYRGFGDSTGEPDFYEPSRQLDDWRAAIAFARSLPDIDPGRVATFGSSSGGGHALAAAAADLKIAAAISQVPMLDRDTQAYNRPQRIVDEIRAAAAEGRYLPAVGQPDEAALIYAPEPRSVGAVSLRLETNLDGGTGFQRLGFWGRRISRFNMPPRFTAPGWFVLVRTIRLPSQGQQ